MTRPTAGTITDAQLDALNADLDRYAAELEQLTYRCEILGRERQQAAAERDRLAAAVQRAEANTSRWRDRAEVADAVTAQTKTLMARRTEALRHRAERAEADRDRYAADLAMTQAGLRAPAAEPPCGYCGCTTPASECTACNHDGPAPAAEWLARFASSCVDIRTCGHQHHAPAAPAANRPAELSDTERQFLTYALDLVADQMASRSNEFSDEDTAALETLRRMATGPAPVAEENSDAALLATIRATNQQMKDVRATIRAALATIRPAGSGAPEPATPHSGETGSDLNAPTAEETR